MTPTDKPDDRRQQVFISYAQADKPIAGQIADALRGAGLRVWFDEWALMPGDSAYIRPMVKHRFDLVEETQPGHLAVVRTPGGLSGSVLAEFSTFAPQGRNRVSTETMRWF